MALPDSEIARDANPRALWYPARYAHESLQRPAVDLLQIPEAHGCHGTLLLWEIAHQPIRSGANPILATLRHGTLPLWINCGQQRVTATLFQDCGRNTGQFTACCGKHGQNMTKSHILSRAARLWISPWISLAALSINQPSAPNGSNWLDAAPRPLRAQDSARTRRGAGRRRKNSRSRDPRPNRSRS
jgi:hypothetical protein